MKWFACAFALALVGAAPAAPPTMEQVLKAARSIQNFSDVQLSPDGMHLVFRFTRTAESKNGPERHSNLYVMPIGGQPWTPLTAAKDPQSSNDERDPQWSPDGTRIAFLSDAGSKGQAQIYVAGADGANARRVGNLMGNVQGLRWSPDGSQLSVLYIAGAHRQTGALMPGARDVGVIGSVIDEQRIATVAVADGSVRFATPAGDYVYEYDWSSDGRKFAFTYAQGNGDDNWWIAKLATVSADGTGMRDVFAPSFQMNAPRWSPDGKSIAVIGGIMSDFGSVGGDVYLVNAATGNPVDVTKGSPFSVRSMQWVGPDDIAFVAIQDGAMKFAHLDVEGGQVSASDAPAATISSWSVAKGGQTAAFVRQSFDFAPEIWIEASGVALHAVTHANADALRFWDKAQSLTWKNDGFTVQGWLIYPLGFDPGKHYPMVVVIHGGPSAASLPNYGSTFTSALTSQGFFVFEPNPRGSFGEGEAFTAANVKDFGYGDFRDDMGGVDAALAAAPIDSQRLGMFGWSYGGYMGMWTETQTTRFKAIVAGAGVVNWQSYYGQNKIDTWMLPFFGASVYEDPAVYAKSSPITFIKQSKTPVLILQGELDEEVPAPQAFEFWHAMKTLGVPTELVVYAGEGHSPQKPADQVDILTRTVGWFQRYLK